VSAARLHSTVSLPVVAAHPVTVSGGGGIGAASGQGFVPASSGGADSSASAGAAKSGTSAGASGESNPTPEQVLQSLVQLLGDEYGEPIVAADGTIYMERKKPAVSGGRLQLSYLVVGKLDSKTGKLQPSEAALKLIQEKSQQSEGGKRVLVKVGDQMVWQTFAKDENGKTVVTDVTAASDEEVAAYQQEQAQAAAAQAKQDGVTNLADWQRKIGQVSQTLGIFGSTGQLVSGLSNGPNPVTGKPGAGWISGWILAQRLNGASEGKLLPGWLSSGPVASIVEWGLQAYGMLDMGNDIRTLREYFGAAKPLPAVLPVEAAVKQLTDAGTHPAVAGALAQLGTEVREGTMQSVAGTANAALLNTKLGAVQLVTKDDLAKAFAATDPVQDAGLKARAAVDSGINKGLGALGKLVQPAMMGATALSFVSSAISLKNLVATQGAKALLDTQQGRSTVLGAATSAAFLGMYLLPMALPALGVGAAAVGAAASAVNIAQNVLGGVQLLNNYGLFGGDGFLDNDALRAAFLIPPLTPLGAFAFWMKSRKKKAEDEAAKLKAAQELAVERVTQQREMAKLQLQSTGTISGATQGADGSVLVSTNVPNDLSQLAAQLGSGGAAAAAPAAAPASAAPASSGTSSQSLQEQRQLTMLARPMR
jgi:hypothetical protein